MKRTFAAAFPVTAPVLMGYLAIGMAFGLMLQSIGYNVLWAFFMSLVIYAGSGQYLGVSLLATGASLPQVAFLTLMVNFRHLVYGLSLIEKLRGMGPRKLYVIFALTDETYALLSSAKPPQGVREHDFYFAVALLDHIYWIGGSVLGSLLGIKPVLHVDSEGRLIARSKVRGRVQALRAIAMKFGELEADKDQVIFISHGDCEKDALLVKDTLVKTFGCAPEKIFLSAVGPVIGSHSGPGTVALFFRGKNRG